MVVSAGKKSRKSPPKKRQRSLQETAYQRILVGITDGAYKPRERLVASTLVSTLKMSRTPVREALHQLRIQGYLEMNNDGSMTVKDYSMKDIQDLYEVREALECAALQLTAARISEQELSRAQKYNDRIKEAVSKGNLLQAHKLGTSFHHEMLYAPAMNDRLLALIRSLRNNYIDRIIRRSATLEDWGNKVRLHDEILAALKRRDAESAKELLLKDLQIGREARQRWYP